MEYLITLVHGTFAPKAPWTRDSSNFCKKVRDALGSESDVEFRTFDWTGKNSNNARLIASEGLAQMLTEQLYLDCDKRKIIIAHSHGGNIAMYALKKIGKQNEEFKLVTMATPFLNSKIRDYEKYFSTHLVLICILLGVISYFFLALTGITIFSKVISPFIEGDNIFVLYFIFLHVLFFFILNQGKRLHAFLQKESLNLPHELQEATERLALNSPACNYSILSVVDHSDEVKLWFEYLFRCWEITLNFYGWLTAMIKYVIIVSFFVLLIVCIFAFFGASGKIEDFPFISAVITLQTLLYLVLLVPVLTILIPFLFLFMRSNPAVLGWESWKSRMFIRTTPATTPLGYSNLAFVQFDLKRNTLLSLKHSIYEHDVVIDHLSVWIRKQCSS